MITEKIQNMIIELAQECEKEDIGLSICAIDRKGNEESIGIAQVGTEGDVEASISYQIKEWEKMLEDCDCSHCSEKLALLNEVKNSEDTEVEEEEACQ
ncbi:hypothetical protein IGI37_002106 [Enterococcus sp. AZ194]|uniref:hypothetical protein n=1 Tax=Enterococcus sp. AZ194 TaxID=2774629 RepID=UPI003F2729EB